MEVRSHSGVLVGLYVSFVISRYLNVLQWSEHGFDEKASGNGTSG